MVEFVCSMVTTHVTCKILYDTNSDIFREY